VTKSQADTSSNKDGNNNSIVSSSAADNNRLENVLILQGGGSLGAFGCGVFKALANNNIKLDIVAGTSIGGINAAIIAGSKNEKHTEQALEQFWLELSEGFVDLDRATFPSLPKFVEEMLLASGYYYNLPTHSLNQQENYSYSTGIRRKYAKLSIGADVLQQIICTIKIRRAPTSYEGLNCENADFRIRY
jgi:Patatin-like phospholipase